MDLLSIRIQLLKDWKTLQTPWAPFLATALLHFVIFTGQLARYQAGVSGFLTWPIIFCALGGILDNIRLYHGAKHGEAGLSTVVTNFRYVFRMVLVPLLFIPLSYMIGEMTSLWFLSIFGRVAAVAFLVHGINEFVIQVAGHFITISEYGVTRHTLDPKMRNASIHLPLLIVAVGGMIAGLAALKTHDATLTAFLQGLCLLGRFSAPASPRYAIATSRALEAVFLYTIAYIQGLVY